MESKSSILWIILMQERDFLQGNMTGETPCLGKFVYIVNLVKAKKSAKPFHMLSFLQTFSSHPGKGRAENHKTRRITLTTGRTPPPPKEMKIHAPGTTLQCRAQMFFDLPIKDANNPGTNLSCKFCVVSKEALIPSYGPQDCIQVLLTGNCKYRKTYRF